MDNVTSKLSLVLLASLVVLSGCFGPGSVSGTVGGVSLNVQDAIFYVIKDDAGKTQGIALALADKSAVCTTVKANRQPKSATSISFGLFNVKVDGAATTLLAPDVGDYTVTNNSADLAKGGRWAIGAFDKVDANCTSSMATSATTGQSGLVTVTTLKSEASGTAEGTFDVSFGTQKDKVTGRFSAGYCDLAKTPTNPSCE